MNGSRKAEIGNRMQIRKPENRETETKEDLVGSDGWADMTAGQLEWRAEEDIQTEEDWGRGNRIDISNQRQRQKDPRTVILQVEQNDREDEEVIDLLNIAGYMKQK